MEEGAEFKTVLYQTAFKLTPDIVLFMREDGSILEANQAAVQAYGYTYNELIQLNINDLRADKDNPLIKAQIAQICLNPYQFEAVHRRKDGRVFPVEVSSNSHVIAGQRVLFSIIRDISERKQVENRLRYLATHDSLTNIPNRYCFEQALQQAVAQSEKGLANSLLFIDLDNFKIVNDTFGHIMGDQLLINVVGVLRSVLRKTDTLARLGGDEFAILLEGASNEEASLVAEKLRAAVEEEELCLNMYGTYFKLTISIGIVAIDGKLSSQEILAYADQALYTAKGCGKNCIKVG